MSETTTEQVQTAMRATRFSDVCGTVDELKRVVYEEPQTVATSPESLAALADDALSMLRRMEPRLHEYERFRAAVVALAAAMQEMGDAPRYDPAAPLLASLLRRGQVLGEEERAAVVAEAEAMREVAIDLEKRLYRYKDLALALGRAYRDVQGGRSWVLDGDEAETAAELPGQPAWARWLPPSPHRERILRYLRAGRAHLLPAGDAGESQDRPPLLQFEDGGVMPLPVVRWSEDVRNFYPADAPPHARGLLYRDEP